MYRGALKSNLINSFTLIYPVILSIVSIYLHQDYIPLIFTIALTIVYRYRVRYAIPLILNTIFIYLFSVGGYIIKATVAPYILLYPFIIGSYFDLDVYPTGFLGPLSRESILISLLYTPAIIFKPTLTLYYTIQYIWILTLSIYSYIKIRPVSIESIHIPRNMVLGRVSKLLVGVKSDRPIYIYISGIWGLEYTGYIEASKSVTLDYKPDSIGSKYISLRIYALDSNLFTSRLIGEYGVEVDIAPFTLVNIRYILRGLGEILARAGLPEVIGLYGLGAGLEGEGRRGRGYGEYGLFRGLIARLIGFELSGLKRGRRRSLEYYGVRQYLAGDDIRDIHWKKSIGRGELYVKEYGGGGGGGGGSGVSLIIVSDLLVSNIEELDRVTNRVLITLYSQTRLGRYRENEVILILISPFNEILYVRGTIDKVLGFYIKMFQKGIIRLFYRYESIPRELDLDFIYNYLRYRRSYNILDGLNTVSFSLSKKVYEIVHSIGYDYPTAYTIISGEAGVLLSEYIKWMLSSSGYRYVDFNEILRGIEPAIIVR